MEFILGGIRLSFCKSFVSMLVILDKTDSGFAAAVDKMEQLHQHLLNKEIEHEAMTCQFEEKRRVDQIRFSIADKKAETALRQKIAWMGDKTNQLKDMVTSMEEFVKL